MSWCKKCHYGSETSIIKNLDTWSCPNCASIGATNKNPFSEIQKKDKRTLKDTRKQRVLKLKEMGVENPNDTFNFNPKDIERPLKRII
jgi:hypothetical protein